MSILVTQRPWHYWISFVLVAAVGLGLFATLIGYYVKVIANKYPRHDQ